MCSLLWRLSASLLCVMPVSSRAADALNLLQFAPPGATVDRSGHGDASVALAAAISAANVYTARGEPACVYIPPGRYRIVTAPPAFARAGCVRGDGPTQSILLIDRAFEGDVFAWSEAWVMTTPGPTVVGLKIQGEKGATIGQNALVFYDRNDEVFLDNVEVVGLHGRALYSGVKKHASQAYMRESHMRSLRFFRDGAAGVPVVEFSSEGAGETDATNEIQLSQVDIFGPAGPGMVIRNNGSSRVRDVMVEELRIEGWQNGHAAGDLLTIGDVVMPGNVNNIRLTDVELIDPPCGYAAIRLAARKGAAAPYQITMTGMIGGGVPCGQGIRIDAGRASSFDLSGIHTLGTNVVIERRAQGIVLNGGGQERHWTYDIDASARDEVSVTQSRPGAGQ